MAPKPILLVLLLTAYAAHAATAPAAAPKAAPAAPAPAAAAPSPSLSFTTLESILEKGGQYKTFERLLKDTQVGVQIMDQLAGSPADAGGATVLAPTDGAFTALKPGTLNKLTAQEQSEVVLYHVLSRYYTADTFETASNPVMTQASSADGTDTVNITTGTNGGSAVNVTTGVVSTWITGTLYTEYPLAVYSVEKVLLPDSLFGPDAGKKKKKKKDSAAAPDSSDGASPKDTPAASEKSSSGRRGWSSWAVIAGAVAVAAASFCA